MTEDLMDGWFTKEPPDSLPKICTHLVKRGIHTYRCRERAMRDSLFCKRHQPKGIRDAKKPRRDVI